MFFPIFVLSADDRKQRVKKSMQRLKDKPAMADNKIILKDKKGGFQLLYLIITELKSHMTC